MAEKETPKIITVHAPPAERREVVLWERDSAHPTGEVFVVANGKSYEVAETKVAQVIDSARRHQHPLQCTMEKD